MSNIKGFTSSSELDQAAKAAREGNKASLSEVMQAAEDQRVSAGQHVGRPRINAELAAETELSMLDRALEASGRYDAIAKSVHAQGPELLFECLAVLDPYQIMALCRSVTRNIAWAVFAAHQSTYRAQVKAMETEGYHLSFSEYVTESQSYSTEYDSDELDEEPVPRAVLFEFCAHELYGQLQEAYLIAEKAAFGDRTGYLLSGLPWASAKVKGTPLGEDEYEQLFTLEEAMNFFDRQSAERVEQRKAKAAAAISAIANIGKRRA